MIPLMCSLMRQLFSYIFYAPLLCLLIFVCLRYSVLVIITSFLIQWVIWNLFLWKSMFLSVAQWKAWLVSVCRLLVFPRSYYHTEPDIICEGWCKADRIMDMRQISKYSFLPPSSPPPRRLDTVWFIGSLNESFWSMVMALYMVSEGDPYLVMALDECMVLKRLRRLIWPCIWYYLEEPFWHLV